MPEKFGHSGKKLLARFNKSTGEISKKLVKQNAQYCKYIFGKYNYPNGSRQRVLDQQP